MSKQQVDGKLAAEGRCRLCLRPSSVRPLTRHRIVPGLVGGPYSRRNCVPLCWACHSLVDGRDEMERRVARRMLRASLWPEEIAFALSRPVWARPHPRSARWSFDKAYPMPSRDMIRERRLAVSA